MKANKSVYWWLLLFLIVSGLILSGSMLPSTNPVYAAESTPAVLPPGPDRFTYMVVDFTRYEWWMSAWRDNDIYCVFFVDHDGLPNDDDIASGCGTDLYEDWKSSSMPCEQTDATTCAGYYLIMVSSAPKTREVALKLPAPDVKVSIDGCLPDSNGWCTEQPSLVLTSHEPLPNESIHTISGYAGSDPFTCKGNSCVFRLSGTKASGVRLTFWSYSTYGDSSEVYSAVVRVIKDGESADRLTPRWYVDVISSQWDGGEIASCSATWESFPPVDGLPQWLLTPETSDQLKSNIPYDYLAANLISQGVTDASACPSGGLNPDGSVNACGRDAAETDVHEWQNRFDELIFTVARDGKIPAQLLKNLFSIESQFWPGVFKNGKDVGLGQMTEGGADTALLWNPSFYNQFCPLVLDKSTCENNGFAQLHPDHQTLLRGALVGSVDARCDDCPLGIDLSRADFSVGVFAHTILANCEQAGKIVQNVTKVMPGETVDYETLWRLTLVNYNAGSGCLAEAVTRAYQPSAAVPLSWDNIAIELQQFCPGAVDYIDKISRDVEPIPEAPVPDVPAPPGPTG